MSSRLAFIAVIAVALGASEVLPAAPACVGGAAPDGRVGATLCGTAGADGKARRVEDHRGRRLGEDFTNQRGAFAIF